MRFALWLASQNCAEPWELQLRGALRILPGKKPGAVYTTHWQKLHAPRFDSADDGIGNPH
jgi:hypothetical protein